MRRPRGRPQRKQHGGPPRHNNFDSNGPEGRVRGNAHQVYEKYIGLARDAQSSGDRVAAETYFQHAEHYYRVLNSRTDPRPNGEGQPSRQSGNGQIDAASVDGRGEAENQPRPAARNEAQPDEAGRADAQPAPEPSKQPPAQVRRARKTDPATDSQPAAGNDAQPNEAGRADAQPAPEPSKQPPAQVRRARKTKPATGSQPAERPADDSEPADA